MSSIQHPHAVLSLLEAYPAHYLHVLAAIGKHPGEIQELLAREALPEISMRHFCIYAYRLIEDGCVLRISSPFNEETLLYYLTPKGENLFRQIEKVLMEEASEDWPEERRSRAASGRNA